MNTKIILIFTLSCVACTSQNGLPNIDAIESAIKTEVDSYYVYKYEGTKYVPENGKTLLIMGQTVEGINEYMDHFSDEPQPGGWSAYWAVSEFVGVTRDNTNNTGSTQNHQMIIDRFPNTALHSAMWMVGTWNVANRTVSGEFDHVILKYCEWAKTVDRPIYLRLGYEFDGPHNELEPEDYVMAYRKIVDMMRSEGLDNVAFVWHSYAAPTYKNYDISEWYPGDEYVDWVGISVFFQPYYGSDLNAEGNAVLDFAKQHKKPVMVAECNPILGIPKKGTEVWDTWFTNFFTMTYEKNIKAICFINEDWTRLTIDGIEEWKDARIYNNKKVSEAWFNETKKDRYLKQSSDLLNQLGY